MSEKTVILQITDPHIMTDPSATLLGINTTESLKAVLQDIRKKNHQYDLLLLTGDLIQDEKASSYSKLSDILAGVNVPIYWLPGNHDIPELLTGAFTGGSIFSQKSIALLKWQIIMLNCQIPHEVPGLLAESELEFLETQLKGAEAQHCLICLHHHPVPIDCKWLDPIGLTNANEFWQIIDKYPQVEGVLCGHIHQEFEGQKNNIIVLASPSTCIQFKPKTTGFALDHLAPGYRILELHTDGKIITSVHRAEDFEVHFDKNAKGY